MLTLSFGLYLTGRGHTRRKYDDDPLSTAVQACQEGAQRCKVHEGVYAVENRLACSRLEHMQQRQQLASLMIDAQHAVPIVPAGSKQGSLHY